MRDRAAIGMLFGMLFATLAFGACGNHPAKQVMGAADLAQPVADLATPMFAVPTNAYFDHDTAAATPSFDQCGFLIALSSQEVLDCSTSSLSEELSDPSLRLYLSDDATSKDYAVQSQGACLAGELGAHVDALYDDGNLFWRAASGTVTLTLTEPFELAGSYDLVFEVEGASVPLSGMFAAALCTQN